MCSDQEIKLIGVLLQSLNLFIAIIIPVSAVIIAYKLQTRKAIRNEKYENFKTLMSLRKNEPYSQAKVAEAFNLIETIWAEHPQVLELYKAHYPTLKNSDDPNLRETSFVVLALEMAKILGYKNLSSQNISKCLGSDDLKYSQSQSKQIP